MPAVEGRRYKTEGKSEERFLTSADRPFRRSERERKNRSASFEVTEGEGWLKSRTGAPS
jgi:hypothetical protein